MRDKILMIYLLPNGSIWLVTPIRRTMKTRAESSGLICKLVQAGLR